MDNNHQPMIEPFDKKNRSKEQEKVVYTTLGFLLAIPVVALYLATNLN